MTIEKTSLSNVLSHFRVAFFISPFRLIDFSQAVTSTSAVRVKDFWILRARIPSLYLSRVNNQKIERKTFKKNCYIHIYIISANVFHNYCLYKKKKRHIIYVYFIILKINCFYIRIRYIFLIYWSLIIYINWLIIIYII